MDSDGTCPEIAALVAQHVATELSRRLLTVEQAATRLNVSRAYVFELIQQHEPRLDSVKLGRRRLIPAEAVEKFVLTLMEQEHS